MAKTKTKAVDAPASPPPKETLSRSVEQSPQNLFAGPGGGNTFTFWMASIAETFTPWGTNYVKRDQELRDFFHSETFLSGAVYTSAISNSQLEWKLDGPEQTTEAVLDLLNKANLGKGWAHFAKQLSVDLYTQDNGAFVEVIRERQSPEAPVIGIQVLDAGRCQRTGDLNIPVIYTDRQGKHHKMPWYSIIAFEEFPSPIESMFNLQYCAVTRALRAAQILRDFAIYKGEKAGGRFVDAIHIVGGVSSKDIEDVKKRIEEQGDNAGLARYLGPTVLASLDPEATVSVATLDFKSLPDSFNLDDEMRWYISSLALAFGRDYQDFAPLPSGNLGSGQQSQTLHKKGRQKASAAFMRMLEQGFNFSGVMPQTVTFEFEQQDLEEDQEVAEIAKTWAETYKLFGEAGVIGPKIARQMLQDEGILKPEFVEALGEEDITPGHPVLGGEKPNANRGPVAKLEEEPIERLETIERSVKELTEDAQMRRGAIRRAISALQKALRLT